MAKRVSREPKPLAEVLKILQAARARRDRRTAEAVAEFEAEVAWAMTLPLYLDDAKQIPCRPSRSEGAAAIGQHRSNIGHILRRQGVVTKDAENWRGKVRRG